MKVTRNLRQIIVTQFKHDASMAYLAQLYGLTLDRVEGIIRDWMIARELSTNEAGANKGET